MSRAEDSIHLASTPLDVATVLDFVADELAGATDLFIGTTRRYTGERETEKLSYEAYESMAVAEIARIVDDARSRWDVLRCAVHHRTGEVGVGETSVLIAVSSRHRADAFEACRYLIEALKQHVPIWKRELWTDGTSEWVGGGSPHEQGSGSGSDPD